jgi:hypothetical protein
MRSDRAVADACWSNVSTSWRMTVLPSDFARSSLRKMCARLVGTAWVITWNLQHSMDIVDEDEGRLEPLMCAGFEGNDCIVIGCGNEVKRD